MEGTRVNFPPLDIMLKLNINHFIGRLSFKIEFFFNKEFYKCNADGIIGGGGRGGYEKDY